MTEKGLTLMREGLAIEERRPDDVGRCRWVNGDRWEQPDDVPFTDDERLAVQFLMALREIDARSRGLVHASVALAKARKAFDEAQREANDASHWFGRALATREFMEELPTVPLSIGNAIIDWSDSKSRYVAITGNTVGLPNGNGRG
jgi:hypothetical protein